jgi:hypothetical protein
VSECQLQSLEQSVIELHPAEKIYRRLRWKTFALSRLAWSRAVGLLRGKRSGDAGLPSAGPSGASRPGPDAFPALCLKPGDRVRVKSHEEILATLDADRQFQGLSYTPAMKRYCGGVYVVFKRVDRVFDERRWKLSKIRNVVLLEGVYCDGAGGPGKEWDGCDRSCFIWWKEGWLERETER